MSRYPDSSLEDENSLFSLATTSFLDMITTTEAGVVTVCSFQEYFGWESKQNKCVAIKEMKVMFDQFFHLQTPVKGPGI